MLAGRGGRFNGKTTADGLRHRGPVTADMIEVLARLWLALTLLWLMLVTLGTWLAWASNNPLQPYKIAPAALGQPLIALGPRRRPRVGSEWSCSANPPRLIR
jgi:hypothetical protein